MYLHRNIDQYFGVSTLESTYFFLIVNLFVVVDFHSNCLEFVNIEYNNEIYKSICAKLNRNYLTGIM